MPKQEEPQALLVVVASKGQARVIETALSAEGIPSRLRRDETTVIEFGNTLGLRPIALHVRHEDLIRARGVLEARGLPSGAPPSDTRSSFGM